MRCWTRSRRLCADMAGSAPRTEEREMGLQMALEPWTAVIPHSRRADWDIDHMEALRQREPPAAERLATTYGVRATRLATSSKWDGQVTEVLVQAASWSSIRDY